MVIGPSRRVAQDWRVRVCGFVIHVVHISYTYEADQCIPVHPTIENGRMGRIPRSKGRCAE